MGTWALAKPKCLPAGLGMSLSVGLFGVFIIAVWRMNEGAAYIPFISEAGANPPESGIFSMFLCVTATLGILTCILRYMIVEECNREENKKVTLMNQFTLVPGILSMIGMVLVGAYPVNDKANLIGHGIGAFLLFFMSLPYGFGQAWVSYRMSPTWHTIAICRIRLWIMIASTLSLVIMIGGAALGRNAWHSIPHLRWMVMQTAPEEVNQDVDIFGLFRVHGFKLLMVSSASEWVLAFLFISYYVTFIKEFTRVAVSIDIRLLVSHFDQEVAKVDERTALL